MILLGCGTSVGVPALGCPCDVCTGGKAKNQRTRASAIFGLPQGNLLIDTSPDLRTQLLRAGIGIVHAVLYTHEHADHIFGMDDLRLFQFYLGHPVPVYCNEKVEQKLRLVFEYAFAKENQTHAGAVPAIDLNLIDDQPFTALETTITPIPYAHGPRFTVLGFRIGNIAYCTDCKTIPDSSKSLLQDLEVLIISALRPTPHPTHMNIAEAIDTAKQLSPKRTIFTHMSCHIDYDLISKQLPSFVELGYDGLRVPLT